MSTQSLLARCNDGRVYNSFVEVVTNGLAVGRCEDTGKPIFPDPTTNYIPLWLEFIADIANQMLKRPNSDERIVELRGHIYEEEVPDLGILNNLYDTGLKKFYYQTSALGEGRWTTFNAEIQSLGTSHIGLVQRYLGNPVVVHGSSQFVTGGAESVLPEELRAAFFM